MTAYIILGLGAAILLLVISLAIAVKVAQSRGKKAAQLKSDLEATQAEIKRLWEYQEKKEEAQKNADAKKETLHTGDATADFDNSIDLLHNASKGGGH
jgi:type II secretory pathway pseudopilin PulG